MALTNTHEICLNRFVFALGEPRPADKKSTDTTKKQEGEMKKEKREESLKQTAIWASFDLRYSFRGHYIKVNPHRICVSCLYRRPEDSAH